MEKVIKFKKLNPDAQIPTYAHEGDIGMDVFATSVEYDRVNDCYIYGTGLACETTGHMGTLGMMKSSIYKHGEADLVNGVGMIDSDQYRGEIKYIYRNRTSLRQRAIERAIIYWTTKPFWYKWLHSFEDEIEYALDMMAPMNYAPYAVGEAVGQLVPLTFDKMKIEEVTELFDTERGTGGFGSSEASKTIKKKSSKKKIAKKGKD